MPTDPTRPPPSPPPPAVTEPVIQRITFTESVTGNSEQIRFDGSVIAVEHPCPRSTSGFRYLKEQLALCDSLRAALAESEAQAIKITQALMAVVDGGQAQGKIADSLLSLVMEHAPDAVAFAARENAIAAEAQVAAAIEAAYVALADPALDALSQATAGKGGEQ